VVELPADLEELLQSWDMAFKDTKASAYVVGQVWARKKADRFLLDEVREKMNFPRTLKAVLDLTEEWPKARLKLIEDKANGPAIIQTLQGHISGLIAVEPDGSKEARCAAVSPEIESGNVYLPHPLLFPWVDGFIGECGVFPNGTYKDRVDTMSQALIRWGGKKKSKKVSPVGMGRLIPSLNRPIS
jgi:predicted phage terminase large subunit-like protein